MKVPVSVASVLGGSLARALGATWSYRVVGEGAVRAPRPLEPAIYTLWHEHLLPLSLLHRGQGAAALVSRHRDGEILSRILERTGYRPVRGSSSRGGREALEEMIRAARGGAPLAFTPDGPRGPPRRCKTGVVRAAVRTGLPIVPVGAASSRGWRLDSWDGFLVPGPGATVHVSYGAPLSVANGREDAPEADDDLLVEWASRVGRAIERERLRCEGRPTR